MLRQSLFAMMLLIGLAWCVPASATFVCAQGATGCTVTTAVTCDAGSGASCNMTTTATHAGAKEFILFHSDVLANTFSSSGDGGFTCPASTRNTDATLGAYQLCYNLNATGGAISIPCTISSTGTAQQDCAFFEFTSNASNGFTLDTSGANAPATCNIAGSALCAGQGLTLSTSNNYLLIQGLLDSGTATAVDQGYTGTFPFGNGFGFKMNVSTAGTTPNWTTGLNTDKGGADGLAIYENAATATNSIPWYRLPSAGPSFAISFLIGILIGVGYAGGKRVTTQMDSLYSAWSLAGNYAGTSQFLLGPAVLELFPTPAGIYQVADKVSVSSTQWPDSHG